MPEKNTAKTEKIEKTEATDAPAEKIEKTEAAAKVEKKDGKKVASDKATRIILLVKDNPKKIGSATRERFKLYGNKVGEGPTVHEFMEAGGERVDLPWDSDPKRNFIRLEPVS